MSLSREAILEEMGITPLWRLRTSEASTEAVVEPLPSAEGVIPAEQHFPQMVAPAVPASFGESGFHDSSWDDLARRIHACRACPLCEHRHQAVPGVGDHQADWLFIGEGPGAEEDVQGEPFVGQAGKLLDAMLAAIDLKRGNRVYIANAVKCRPPGNRTPEAAEMAACKPFLLEQIALIQPKLIVLLGKAAMHAVMADDRALSAMRGRLHQFQGIPVVITYHPAYLLRNLPDKAKAWEDLLFARRVMAGWRPAS